MSNSAYIIRKQKLGILINGPVFATSPFLRVNAEV